MADVSYVVQVVVHIACAATAFGVALPVGGALRRATTQGREVRVAAADTAARAGKIAGIFGLLTLITGLGLIFYRGGMKAVPPTIHAGMGIVLIMILLGALFMRPLGKRLVAAVDKAEGDWRALTKQFGMGVGIMHLLWLATLTLMFIK